MKLSKLQLRLLYKVLTSPDWYRAATSGERVTLASLYYQGFLIRRVWRPSKTSPAHEYQAHQDLKGAWENRP
jgi:hypothetical protein